MRIGQPFAFAQQLGPDQAHRQVAIAEPEPRGPARGLERVHHLPGVACDPEPASVDQVREPVGDEIRVG